MKKYVNGQYVEITPEEIAFSREQNEAFEREYWQSVSYEDAVNSEIRKRYTESAEFAILRQKDEKPEEYAAYYVINGVSGRINLF